MNSNHQQRPAYLLPLIAFLLTIAALLSTPSSAKAQTSCGLDTIAYTGVKATGVSQLMLSPNHLFGAGQWFEFEGSATLSGVNLMAGVHSGNGQATTATATVSVYSSTQDSLPTGFPLATANVTLDTSFRWHQVAFFNSVNITDDFFVAVEYGSGPFDGDTVMLALNSPGDGGGEALAGGLYDAGGTEVWLPFAQAISSPDRDVLLYPWMEFDLQADFNAPGDSLCVNESIGFANNTPFFAMHRMYNRRVLEPQIFGPAFTWDFGDGTTSNAALPQKTYGSTGDYTVVLTTRVEGYFTQCSDPAVMGLTIMERPVASFMPDAMMIQPGDTVSFTYLGAGGNDCIWDFGDGQSVQMCGDVVHVYDSAGTYQVELWVIGNYGCGEQDSVTIQVGNVNGREELPKSWVKVFPNPSNGSFKVQWDGVDMEWVRLLDLAGKERIHKPMQPGQRSYQEDLDGLPVGIYLLQLGGKAGIITKKIIIQK